MRSLDSSSDPKINRILAQSKNWTIPHKAAFKASLIGMGLPLLVSAAMAQEPNNSTMLNTQSALEQARAMQMASQAPAQAPAPAQMPAPAQAPVASSAPNNMVSAGQTMSALEAARAAASASARTQVAATAPAQAQAPVPVATRAAPITNQNAQAMPSMQNSGAPVAPVANGAPATNRANSMAVQGSGQMGNGAASMVPMLNVSTEPTSPAAAVAASLASKQAAYENRMTPPSARENQGGGIMFNHKHHWFYDEQLQEEDVINLNVQMGGMTVPRPNMNTDYSANKSFIGHGNAHYDAPNIKTNANNTGANAKEDPLASPYYDPFTGEVNVPESVKAQQRLDRIAAEQQKKLTEEEDRLAQYDIDRAKQLTEDPNYKPFGDFAAHDRMYRRMPLGKDVFYVASGKDIKWLHNQIAPIERDLGADIGFVLLDQNGLVALKDNSPFPLYGLSKFHLSYAVGALMSVRAENSSHQVKFDAGRLSRNIVSPLLESLTGANRAAIEESVTGGYGARRSKSERNRMLASAAKKVQSGTAAKDRAEARANSVPINQQATAYTTETHGNNMTISLGELMFYNLALGDANASSILLDYLGTIKTLEVFDKTKGLEHVQYKTSELDTAISPVLIENNHAPLYESAKLFASYSQDKDISLEVRQAINDMLYNNQATRNTIQKGVRESIVGESVEVLNNFNIYSQGQSADYIEARRSRPVVSDMALIEYRGQRIVMVIACRNIKGQLNRTQVNAEDAIASVARVLFEYEKYRINSRNFK